MLLRRHVAVAALSLSLGCAASQHALSFDPGEYASPDGAVTIEVREARYEARQLTIKCTLTNRGESDLQVERSGVLLADGDLELPLSDNPVAAGPETMELGVGQTQPVTFAFDVGGLEPVTRTLRLRAVRVGDTPQPPVSVMVPGITTGTEENA
ncbi:MAG: hypothetical protein AAGA54_10085 [Myxococcota bacterium]